MIYLRYHNQAVFTIVYLRSYIIIHDYFVSFFLQYLYAPQ